MMTGKLHKWLGVILLLPLLGWCATGAIFLFQPGYGDAYKKLTPRYYSLPALSIPPGRNEWLEVRQVQTVLGTHLLAKTKDGWQQYNADTMAKRGLPASADIKKLLEDAIGVDQKRYGESVAKSADGYVTASGVRLSFDWDSLSIEQYGKDRALIDALYDIHYLRWTGNRAVDNVIAVLGLCCLVLTTVLGVTLMFSRRSVR